MPDRLSRSGGANRGFRKRTPTNCQQIAAAFAFGPIVVRGLVRVDPPRDYVNGGKQRLYSVEMGGESRLACGHSLGPS